MFTNLWVWVAAFLTLCVLTFLYKDNPFFKFAEHLLVGVALGYIISIYYHNSFIPMVWEPLLNKEFIIIIPTLLGFLSFSILVPKYSWFVRYPIAFVIGVWSGISIPRNFQGLIFEQIQGTLITTLTVSGIIMVIGVITTVIYFYFSAEHKGAIGGVARIGIWFIMLAFGAGFGYTVMARVSLLIGRMQFLLHDWLGIIR